jgi:WD40 repeat protein
LVRVSPSPCVSESNLSRVWDVKYNRFHDQLVLSAGSDNTVNLWRASSVSSAPMMQMSESESGAENIMTDVKLQSLESHEDCVYSVAWSAMDSWTFAALSYDGKVTLNQVPSSEKYRILL